MNVEVVISDNFRKEAKKYLKKFPSLKKELNLLAESLVINPKQGVKLTETTYKIRLASKSKGKGKSGGFRVVTYIIETIEEEIETIVTLLSIYDKSEVVSLNNASISQIINEFLTQKLDTNLDPNT